VSRGRQLKQALLLFVNGYPDNEWMGHLHEEGCPAVHWRKYSDGTRDEENECVCDGDWATTLVLRLTRPDPKRRGYRK